MSPSQKPPSSAAPRGRTPRVVQAYFPEGRAPARRAPHPATVAGAAQPFFRPDTRPPHPATVGRGGLAAAQARPQAAQPAAGTHAFRTPPGFLEGTANGAGQPLPPPVQRKMEAFFGADFSDVRVHVGQEAASIGALAFTIGSDVYFAPGQYEPHSPRGQELIGHELAHVLQQREGRVANPFGDGVAVVQDPSLEEEANRLGREAAAQPRMSAAARPPHPAVAGRSAQAAPARAAQPAPNGGYELVVGAYLHPDADKLPEDLAGHSFVAIREPSGESRAFGFSPANFGAYDPRGDLGRLQAGVDGVVHDDSAAFDKPGVKTRSYRISRTEAQAAMAKIAEYQSGKYPFSLRTRQCSTFAFDVMRAASLPVPSGARVHKPREVYAGLPEAPAARRWPPR